MWSVSSVGVSRSIVVTPSVNHRAGQGVRIGTDHEPDSLSGIRLVASVETRRVVRVEHGNLRCSS
jgi:hypothetical protein